MKIRFLFFASIRDVAKTGEMELEFNGTTVEEALTQLKNSIPGLAPHLDQAQVAVNEKYSERSAGLQEGDVLALIPPVSGGAHDSNPTRRFFRG